MKEYILNIEEDSTGETYFEVTKEDIVEEQINQYQTTTGTTEPKESVIYLSVSNIVKKLSDEFPNIQKPQMKDLFLRLFESFIKHLRNYSSQYEELSHLPQIHLNFEDDGTILIEWLFFGFNIGFTIESEITQSSWYLVSNEKLDYETASGFLNTNNIEGVLDDLFNFILKNT
jgi:heat shock protein HspQ